MSVFSREWFRKHQRRLLWLCNSPVTRDWFRDLLRIHRDHPVAQPIVQIMPQWVILANGGNEFTLDTRCAPKFAHRLYHGLLPLWWTMHGWDQLIANRYRPAWNLGFDTLTGYPEANPASTAGDCYANKGTAQTWSTIRSGQASGSSVNGVWLMSGCSVNPNPNYWMLYRSWTCFDTSPLTLSAMISAATFSLYTAPSAGDQDTLDVNPGFNVTSGSLSDPTTFNTIYDWTRIGSTAFSSEKLYNDITWGAYIDYTLNSSGKASISKTGVSQFAILLTNDISGTDPNWHGTSGVELLYTSSADTTGTIQDPKLVVTYTIPPVFIPQVIIC